MTKPPILIVRTEPSPDQQGRTRLIDGVSELLGDGGKDLAAVVVEGAKLNQVVALARLMAMIKLHRD